MSIEFEHDSNSIEKKLFQKIQNFLITNDYIYNRLIFSKIFSEYTDGIILKLPENMLKACSFVRKDKRDYRSLISRVELDASELLQENKKKSKVPTGYILDERGLFYVLDVHKDELIYLYEPVIYIPDKKPGKGRTPHRLKTDDQSLRLDRYMVGLVEKDWKKVGVRKTAKGWLKLKVHVVEVWVWDGNEARPRRKTLIITKTIENKPKVKYSFSSGTSDQYTHKDYAYFQAQRYWIERTFDDSKNELGMSDYQIRKWIGWHHHQALVMLAGLILLEEKINSEQEFPLMSMRDARILMVLHLFGTIEQYNKRLDQMKKRHVNRKKDIDKYYRYDKLRL